MSNSNEVPDTAASRDERSISIADLEFVGSKSNGFVHAANQALPPGEVKFPLEDQLVAEALLGVYFTEILEGQNLDAIESRYGACALELLQFPTNRDKFIMRGFGISDPATSADVLSVVARRAVSHIFMSTPELAQTEAPVVVPPQEKTESPRKKPVRAPREKPQSIPVQSQSLVEENSGTDWHNRAECRDSIARGKDLWSDEDADEKTLAEAKRICATCDVAAACLNFALAKDIRHGIWGGLEPKARRKIALRRPQR